MKVRDARFNVGWRDLEVRRAATGDVSLALHGAAAAAVASRVDALALSLSHEGDYATAVVVTHVQEIPS